MLYLLLNFKKHVLDFAVNQVNEFTDINVCYEQHKDGRTINGFTFNFTIYFFSN